MDPQILLLLNKYQKKDRFWLNKIKVFMNNLTTAVIRDFVEATNYKRSTDSLHYYRFYKQSESYLLVTFPSFAVFSILMKKKKSKQISLVSSITTGHHGYHWPPHAATMTPKPHPTPNRAPYINSKKVLCSMAAQWCSILNKNNS